MQASSIPGDRENSRGHFDADMALLMICSSIVTSRKRKLRELFAIATESQGIPNHSFDDPDATPATPAESQFLLDSDILL